MAAPTLVSSWYAYCGYDISMESTKLDRKRGEKAPAPGPELTEAHEP